MEQELYLININSASGPVSKPNRVVSVPNDQEPTWPLHAVLTPSDRLQTHNDRGVPSILHQPIHAWDLVVPDERIPVLQVLHLL